MRLDRLVSIASFALVSVVAAACGDDGAPQFIDASIPDAEPIPPDAEPFSCTAPEFDCGGVCVDLDEDEATCGDCDTACTGGEYCNGGTCECPEGFVPDAPSFGLVNMVDNSQIPGTTLGIGLYSFMGGGHIMLGGYTTATTTVDTEYTFDADPLTMPLLGAGYNVDIQAQSVDSAFAATAGTITFDTICAGGFSGSASNVTFSGVESLFNPVIVPGGCTFTVTGPIAFSYGDPCPAP
jgi:hypothetical protein